MLGFTCSLCHEKVLYCGPPLSATLMRQCEKCNGPLSEVFKLPCSHLVHRVCFSHTVSQADEVACPTCLQPVTNPNILKVFREYAYDIILTKLYKFTTTAAFKAANPRLKDFFRNQLNLLLGTNTFVGDAEEGKWPDFQSHTFVKYFLQSAKDDPDLMSQLAEFVVQQHCCDGGCPEDCKDKAMGKSSSFEVKLDRINAMLGELRRIQEKEHLVEDFRVLSSDGQGQSGMEGKHEMDELERMGEVEMERLLAVNLKDDEKVISPKFTEEDWQND